MNDAIELLELKTRKPTQYEAFARRAARPDLSYGEIGRSLGISKSLAQYYVKEISAKFANAAAAVPGLNKVGANTI
jgi:hypothetical protein